MEKLLRLSLLTSCLILFSLSGAFAQNEFKVGGGLAFGSEVEAIGLQANAVYGFTEEIRGAADFTLFFPDNFDWYGFNANGHYKFVSEEGLTAYGLAGLNLTTISVDLGQFGSASNTEFGLNLGGGAEFGLDFASLFGELKYVVSDADQLVLTAGLRFSL